MRDTNVRRPFRRRNVHPPIVHKEYSSLGTGIEYKVRVIQYKHPHIGTGEPMLDIREFITNQPNPDGTTYTGFGPAGVSLSLKDLFVLSTLIGDAMETIKKLGGKVE